RMAEQPTADFGERQYAGDDAVPFRVQIMATVAEPFDDFAPGGTMEKRGLRRARDKCVPKRFLTPIQAFDDTGIGGKTVVRVVRHAASPSLRAQFGGRKRRDRIHGVPGSEKHPVHAIEAEIAQQPLDSGRRARQVKVMTYPVLQCHAGHPRLPGVNFPWMKIKYAGPLLAPVDTAQTTLEQRIGKQPEVAASTTGPVAP